MHIKVVATYANNTITTMQFPNVIMQHAAKFHRALDLLRSYGYWSRRRIRLFRDYEYERLITTANRFAIGAKNDVRNGQDRNPGLRMTAESNDLVAAVVKALIENQQLILATHRTFSNSTFIHKGASYEAEPDTTMTW